MIVVLQVTLGRGARRRAVGAFVELVSVSGLVLRLIFRYASGYASGNVFFFFFLRELSFWQSTSPTKIPRRDWSERPIHEIAYVRLF